MSLLKSLLVDHMQPSQGYMKGPETVQVVNSDSGIKALIQEALNEPLDLSGGGKSARVRTSPLTSSLEAQQFLLVWTLVSAVMMNAIPGLSWAANACDSVGAATAMISQLGGRRPAMSDLGASFANDCIVDDWEELHLGNMDEEFTAAECLNT
ncbi:hypothetical protein RhiLY_11309 [Ceratobasidium sp. AG-Ba]|nr:hypothetical protein RhiLY_11309 [Ceratobasidium sp. AG-Ba]